MRWDHLFADLEGQFDAASSAQFSAEVSEMTRGERAAVELAARFKSSRGSRIRLELRDGDFVEGEVSEASALWVLMTSGSREHVVPMPAVMSVAGLTARAAPLGEVDRRLSLGHAMRALSRDRARVVVQTDAGAHAGVIGAVGADHMDVATALGERAQMTVPFAAIVQVRSAESHGD